jgi:hypothetical protein
MKMRYLALLSLLTLVLVACGPIPQPSTEANTSTPVQPTPGESPLSEPEVSPLSPLPTPPADPVAAAAVAHLAAELDTSAEEVTVLSSEAVEWRDTSLGCPQPGMMYAQVITPGYRFLLQAKGREYDVHTDQTGQSVVTCQPDSSDQSAPETAFQALLDHLNQMYPGFGLYQQEEWISQDITKSAMVGISTWAWRSGEWALEMSFPAVPQPAYESVLFHRQAGTVWRGTLEADGRVIPLFEPPFLSFEVGSCDETIPSDTLHEWAGVEITVQEGAIHVEQKLAYVCCADLILAAGRDGEVIRLVETNVGEVCRCMCGYPVTADLTGLDPGAYTVEVWGVQHFDVHPLELLGSAEVTIP